MKRATILFAALFAAARAAFGAPCPPVEYELLQYVATDGNLKPYVDTGHRPTSNTKVAIDMVFLGAADTYTASEWIAIWGYRKTYKTDMFAFFVKKDASQVALNYKTTDVQPASGILLGERFIFRNDNARQYVTRVERGEQETCIHSAADQSFAAGSGWTITIFGMRGFLTESSQIAPITSKISSMMNSIVQPSSCVPSLSSGISDSPFLPKLRISNFGGASISCPTYIPFFFRCFTHSESRYSICPLTERKSASAHAAMSR